MNDEDKFYLIGVLNGATVTMVFMVMFLGYWNEMYKMRISYNMGNEI